MMDIVWIYMDIMKLMPTTTRQPLQNHWISYTKGPRLKILKSNPLTTRVRPVRVQMKWSRNRFQNWEPMAMAMIQSLSQTLTESHSHSL